MTKEQAIEVLEKIDVKFFISGMTEQKDYIIDKADEVNVAIETVLSMLEEKDKIIDLMSETINNHDIDEDICKQMGQKEDCNEFEDKEKCKDCIKQYFENKVKK